MLKGDSSFLAGVVVRVSVLWALSDVVAGLFTPFTDVTLRQLLDLLKTRFWLPGHGLTTVSRRHVLLLVGVTTATVRLGRFSHAWLEIFRPMVAIMAPWTLGSLPCARLRFKIGHRTDC